ncbi:MAG: aldo/keto reductase [Planctomycetota bacterium]
MDRHELLRSALGLAAGLALAPRAVLARGRALQEGETAPLPAPKTLPARSLGASGPAVTMLGLGGFHVGGRSAEKEARELVETAYAEGVRFFDNAESYQDGQAERWMGGALEGIRDQVFLMTKTHSPADRSAESARRHLEGSLERLRTDRLDLWQLHSVQSPEDVDRAFAPGGAMEYILAMKEKGVVKHVGVTGHHDPAANARALEHFDRGMRFDVMQMPLNPVDFLQKSFQKSVLPGLVERKIGVIAMKTLASGRILAEGLATVEECLRYVWTLPVSVAVVGMETPEQVRTNAALARAFAPLSPVEVDALHARLAPRAALALEWYKNG